MQYLLLFLEGMITFISPCILPMLPVYIAYFSGSNEGERKERHHVAFNVIGFVLGFMVVFTMIGAMAGTFGALIKTYQKIVNILCGAIVVLFGLNYIGILNIRFLMKERRMNYEMNAAHFLSSVLFGIVFSIGWTPCVGTFLGSALMMAVYSGNTIKGVVMLLIYSLGLGIPFMLCGIFIDSIKEAFDVIKSHYSVINKIAGGILVITGILMMTGTFYKVILNFAG